MAQEAAKTPKRSSPIKTAYLILYNAVSAILWATVLGRTVGANMLRGPAFVYVSTGDFVLWTQTLMIMDVLHGLFGMSIENHFGGPVFLFFAFPLALFLTGVSTRIVVAPSPGQCFLAELSVSCPYVTIQTS